MCTHGVGERTAVTANRNRALRFLDICQSAERGENGSRTPGSIAEISLQRRLILRELLADIAKKQLELIG